MLLQKRRLALFNSPRCFTVITAVGYCIHRGQLLYWQRCFSEKHLRFWLKVLELLVKSTWGFGEKHLCFYKSWLWGNYKGTSFGDQTVVEDYVASPILDNEPSARKVRFLLKVYWSIYSKVWLSKLWKTEFGLFAWFKDLRLRCLPVHSLKIEHCFSLDWACTLWVSGRVPIKNLVLIFNLNLEGIVQIWGQGVQRLLTVLAIST